MIILLLRNIHALEKRICELEEAVRFQTTVELEPRAQFVGIDQSKDVPVMSLADAQRLGHARVDRKERLSTGECSAFRSNIELAVNKGVLDARGKNFLSKRLSDRD